MDVKLYEVCRACMSNQRDFSNSFDFTQMSEKVIEMFTFCTTIQVLKDDGLPLNICSQCVENVQICYDFINVCKSTDEALRHYVGGSLKAEKNKNESDIKNESPATVKEEPDYAENSYLENNDDCYSDKDNDSEDEKILDIKNKLTELKRRTRSETSEKPTPNINESDDVKCDNVTSDTMPLKKRRRRKEPLNGVLVKVPVTDPETGSSIANKYRYRKSYKCNKCSEEIIGLGAYNRHKRDVHLEYKIYKCEACNKTFDKHRSMVVHLKVHERPYKCKICPNDFRRKDKLKLHVIMSHTIDRPFKCNLCPLQFKTKEYLRVHNFLHEDDRRYLCEYCGASFNSAQSGTLKIHIRTHTGEKPYCCKVCPKTFRTVHQLYKHQRTHENLRTYKCSFCHKGFNHRASMVVHERIHTGERPYKCEYCPREFIDNWKRKIHYVSGHNIPKENIQCGQPGKRSKYYKLKGKNEDGKQKNNRNN